MQMAIQKNWSNLGTLGPTCRHPLATWIQWILNNWESIIEAGDSSFSPLLSTFSFSFSSNLLSIPHYLFTDHTTRSVWFNVYPTWPGSESFLSFIQTGSPVDLHSIFTCYPNCYHYSVMLEIRGVTRAFRALVQIIMKDPPAFSIHPTAMHIFQLQQVVFLFWIKVEN